MSEKYSVAIIGSGNWATTIAKNIGINASINPNFESDVYMYVYEEFIEGRKLTDIINSTHENVKYMPGYKLPPNIIAVPDVLDAARNADIIIFAIPTSFVINVCKSLLGKVKPTAQAVSLLKGFERGDDGQVKLISQIIQRNLKISCSVLVGCNLAHEISNNKFCEGTIGCRDQPMLRVLQDIFKSETFRVDGTDDSDCVEICATLRNIIAFGAGIADGMELNENTKSGIIRRGFLEVIQFVDVFFPGSRMSTLFQPCGLSDMITSCYANRNRKLAEAFVKSGKPLAELEQYMLPNQDPMGPITAEMVNIMLASKGMEDKFPLFTTVHKICIGDAPLTSLVETLRYAQEDIYHPVHTFPL